MRGRVDIRKEAYIVLVFEIHIIKIVSCDIKILSRGCSLYCTLSIPGKKKTGLTSYIEYISHDLFYYITS
jgi:hypothetical protein